MPDIITPILATHIISSTVWFGTTCILAWRGYKSGIRLYWAQLGSAAVTFLAGGALWSTLHAGSFERYEKILAIGVATAVLAIVVQIALRSRMLLAQRAAVGLLTISAIAMVAARRLA